MNKILLSIATALTLVATPALASDFSGPRVEVTAGTDTASHSVDTKDVTYGVTAGYDHTFGKVLFGVEAGVDNVFDRTNIAVGGRIGYVLNDNVLVYGKAGYSNWKQVATHKYEGLRLGGGVEANLVGPFYGKIEYRHVDYGAVKTNGGVVGFGIRF